MTNPCPGYRVTTPYGVPGNWAAGVHTGEDYACPIGTVVVAATGGTVTFEGWADDYGNRVEVKSDDGSRQFSYSHLDQIDVYAGQHVESGQRIGLSGTTGRSTGPHLHYEERDGGFGYNDHVSPIYPYQDEEGNEDYDMSPFVVVSAASGAAFLVNGPYISGLYDHSDVVAFENSGIPVVHGLTEDCFLAAKAR